MGDSIRILHVDDDSDFAGLTAEFLERQDDRFTVSAAIDADEGMKRIDAETFDCVVSDYDMPGRNGIEFLTAVRETYPDLPFILFTGKGSEEVASDAISAGVTDYLQKATGSEQYELLANRIVTAVEQYRTERELERQNDLFEKAQAIADVGAWEYDLETDDSYVSDEILRIHGLDTDTRLPPDASLEYYHPDDRADIRTAFRLAIEEGEPYDLVARLIDADGQQRWVRTRGEPQSDDGGIVRLRGILQDISDQKRREMKLERQNERLEEFAHVVSHDIRNPLQVASGQLEVAERTGDAGAFRKAQESLERISAIVENILTLAKHGRMVEETEQVQLTEIATDAWDTVETGEHTLECEGSCHVDADSERLRQLLENLFHNAVEHGSTSPASQAQQNAGEHGSTSHGSQAHDREHGSTSPASQSRHDAGGETTVRVGPIEPMFTSTRATGDRLRGFYVADDGPGIPEDIREQVFESGFTTATEGTGFGLAIVAQIAEAHGWATRVTESRDGGARFEFTKQHAPTITESD